MRHDRGDIYAFRYFTHPAYFCKPSPVSNDALNWAFAAAITGPCKPVLVALADHADAAGQCWPTIERLVLFSGVSERTVQRSILELERDGFIAIERSRGGKANRFRLIIGAEKTPTPPECHPATVAPTVPDSHRLDNNDPGDTPPVWHPNPATQSGNPATQSGNPATVAPKPLEPSITPIEPPRARAIKSPAVVLPDWMPAEAWNGYIESRVKLKKPPTPRAVELLVKKLDAFRSQGMAIDQILDASAVSGWTDVYPLRNKPGPGGGTRAAFAMQFQSEPNQ